MAIKQPVIRCVIFVVVVGFSLLVCLPVRLFVYFFGQCYSATKCSICGGLTDLMNAVPAASLHVCCCVR